MSEDITTTLNENLQSLAGLVYRWDHGHYRVGLTTFISRTGTEFHCNNIETLALGGQLRLCTVQNQLKENDSCLMSVMVPYDEERTLPMYATFEKITRSSLLGVIVNIKFCTKSRDLIAFNIDRRTYDSTGEMETEEDITRWLGFKLNTETEKFEPCYEQPYTVFEKYSHSEDWTLPDEVDQGDKWVFNFDLGDLTLEEAELIQDAELRKEIFVSASERYEQEN